MPTPFSPFQPDSCQVANVFWLNKPWIWVASNKERGRGTRSSHHTECPLGSNWWKQGMYRLAPRCSSCTLPAHTFLGGSGPWGRTRRGWVNRLQWSEAWANPFFPTQCCWYAVVPPSGPNSDSVPRDASGGQPLCAALGHALLASTSRASSPGPLSGLPKCPANMVRTNGTARKDGVGLKDYRIE